MIALPTPIVSWLSSLRFEAEPPPGHQQVKSYRNWNPPLLGNLPDDFLRILPQQLDCMKVKTVTFVGSCFAFKKSFYLNHWYLNRFTIVWVSRWVLVWMVVNYIYFHSLSKFNGRLKCVWVEHVLMDVNLQLISSVISTQNVGLCSTHPQLKKKSLYCHCRTLVYGVRWCSIGWSV